MLFLSFLLLFNSPGRANDNETCSKAIVFQNASCNEDFMCYFLSVAESDRHLTESVNATLNERFFSSMDKHEENRSRHEEQCGYQNKSLSGGDLSPKNATALFIKLQLQRLAGKQTKSRALRSARRLAIAADCLRPALVCIASEMTCLHWGDSGYDVYAHFRHLNRILIKESVGKANQIWTAALSAMANIKGALRLIQKSRNILKDVNWFARMISSQGAMEDSDCVFLVTDTKEDALLILSESSWSASARYVVVIMAELSSEEYDGGLFEEGIEKGENIDDVVFAEFDLHSYEESVPNTTNDANREMFRNRRRREVPKAYNSVVHTLDSRRSKASEKCLVSAHNLLHLLWYNRRLLHTAVIHRGCNLSSTVGFIRGNVSTIPIYLLTHSGELIILPGDAIAATWDWLTKPLKDFGGRTLRISLFERRPTATLVPSDDGGPPKFAGMEAWLLRLTARYLNFRVLVEQPEDNTGFGHLFQNGTASGTLSDILNGKADISFNGFLVMDYGTRAVEFSSAFTFDALCVVVPRTAALPRWAALLTTLPPVIIAVTPPTIVCLTLVLAAIRRTLHYRGLPVSDMLSVISVCLSVATRMPNLCSQRILLIGATVAALVIAGAFQGLIVRSIALPQYPMQIDTLTALDQSGLYVATGSETFKSTFDVPGGSPVMEHLSRKTIVLTTREEWNRYLGHVGVLVRLAGIKCHLTSKEHLVKDCPRQYPVAFLMRRGSPIKSPLNRLILRYAAAGITDMYDYWTHGYHRDEHLKDTPRKVFSLEDLEGPFIVLGCGLGLSAVVFFFYEIRIFRCRKGVGNDEHRNTAPHSKHLP